MVLSPPAKLERRRPISVPAEIQLAVRTFAQQLIEQHGNLFSQDRQMKSKVGATLRRYLPPQPGRPGFVNVSAAIRLHDELKRSSPEKPSKEIWAEIYVRLIPRWRALNRIDRRAEADELHRRVRWRLYARKRKRRKTRTGKLTA